jgi:hypothetical protein
MRDQMRLEEALRRSEQLRSVTRVCTARRFSKDFELRHQLPVFVAQRLSDSGHVFGPPWNWFSVQGRRHRLARSRPGSPFIQTLRAWASTPGHAPDAPLRQREAYAEGGALPGLRVHRDAAAVRFRDPLADGEAETRAAFRPGALGVGAVEPLEDVVLVLG